MHQVKYIAVSLILFLLGIWGIFLNRKNINTGRRKIDSYSDCDILMDAQISINSPVKKSNSVY